jgi:hypothetical protein
LLRRPLDGGRLVTLVHVEARSQIDREKPPYSASGDGTRPRPTLQRRGGRVMARRGGVRPANLLPANGDENL